MKKLYPHQEEALNSILPEVTGNPLLVIPKCGGKSLINAHLCAANFTGRTLCLTHVKELITQNYEELRDEMPFVSAGIYCDGLNRKDVNEQVIFASVASVYTRPELFKSVTQIIVDEAHRVSPTRGKMYRAVLSAFPGTPVVGLTATPFRPGTGLLHEGDERLFDRIAYECSVKRLMDEHLLAPLTPFAPRAAQLPTNDLHVRGGEFVQAELDALVAAAPLTHAALTDAMARTDDRRHILAFACNVDHAKMVCAYLRLHGETADVLYGDLPGKIRDERLRAFKTGQLRWLVNVAILTTGFNFRGLDCIVNLRPTASPVIYVQICGRGTRTNPGKEDCLYLDYGGNVARHGLFDDPMCGKKEREPLTVCANCEALYPTAFAYCPRCQTETPRLLRNKPTIRIEGRESGKMQDRPHEFPLLDDGSKWRQLESWTWKAHTSKAGNACLWVRYRAKSGERISEYLVEGSRKLTQFLNSAFEGFPAHPTTVADAMRIYDFDNRLPQMPGGLLAKKQDDNPDYWQILHRVGQEEFSQVLQVLKGQQTESLNCGVNENAMKSAY